MVQGGVDHDILLTERETLPIHSTSDYISVLHVDDDADVARLTAEYLEREMEDVEIITKTSARDGVELLTEEDIDCIVSDYDMPDTNGLEFLSLVRDDHPDLPFILFTGKGSEEIAAEAISAGVTDYLQKSGSSDQYTVLANRIENTVSQHRAEQTIESTTRWYSTILEHSSDYVMIVGGNGDIKYVTPPIERVMGYSPAEIIGEDSFDFAHPDDLEQAMVALSEIISDPSIEKTVEFRAQHNDGSWRWLEVRGRNLLDDPVINGVMVNVRDITERKEREQALERQSDRLEELTSFLSHDLRNQLNVLDGRLDLAQSEATNDFLEAASDTIDRIHEMVNNFAELSKKGRIPTEAKPLQLSVVTEAAWNPIMPDEATLHIGEDTTITADEERLRSVLENLFQNAKEHVGRDVSVTVGALEDASGFYVEDDGPSIPASEREDVFSPGFSPGNTGTGFGLAIVKQVAGAHGWEVTITDGEQGGARFEFTDRKI